MKLAPNNVYVIPPNKLMVVSGGRLKLSPRTETDTVLAVDHFFRSLAEAEGNRAIGVILSGNGSDGTQGCLAIKSAGGITIAQEEKSAKYPAMPGSAITAGCVDFVLSPERIAQELARLAGHPYTAPITEPEEPEAPGRREVRSRRFCWCCASAWGWTSRITNSPRCSGASSGAWRCTSWIR